MNKINNELIKEKNNHKNSLRILNDREKKKELII